MKLAFTISETNSGNRVCESVSEAWKKVIVVPLSAPEKDYIRIFHALTRAGAQFVPTTAEIISNNLYIEQAVFCGATNSNAEHKLWRVILPQ